MNGGHRIDGGRTDVTTLGAAHRVPWDAGCSVGIAAGLATFSLLVPLSGVSYFIGSVKQQKPAYEAADAAGLLFLVCLGTGMVAGALLAIIARSSVLWRCWMRRAGSCAFGVYLLCLRGAWGPPPVVLETESRLAPAPQILGAEPIAAVVVPLSLSAVAIVALLVWRLRTEKAVGIADEQGNLAGLHALCCLAAAHVTVQLPYYVSRAPGFFAGLGSVFRALAGG